MYACNVSDFIAPTNSLLATRECLSHQCWSVIFISKVQLSTVEIKITEAERNHFICLPKPLHPQPNYKLISLRLDYAREALKLLVVVDRWQDWKNWVLYIPVYGGAVPTNQVKGFQTFRSKVFDFTFSIATHATLTACVVCPLQKLLLNGVIPKHQ